MWIHLLSGDPAVHTLLDLATGHVFQGFESAGDCAFAPVGGGTSYSIPRNILDVPELLIATADIKDLTS